MVENVQNDHKWSIICKMVKNVQNGQEYDKRSKMCIIIKNVHNDLNVQNDQKCAK